MMSRRRVKVTSQALPRIKVTSQTFPRIESEEIAEALGADPEKVQLNVRQTALSLLRVRQELHERLSSTGGRPSLEGTIRRQKIPLQESDWERLQELAQILSDEALHPTAGQIASVLLRQALDEVNIEELRVQLE